MTLTASEPVVGPDDTAAPRPVRWRRYAVALVVALVTGAAIAWLATYQPLVTGRGGYAAGLLVNDGYESTALDNAFGEERRIVKPSPGDEIGMLFPLHNEGPMGITVVSIGQPFNPTGTVGTGEHPDETSAATVTRATDPGEQRWVELTPFALPAGAYAPIRLSFRILECATELTAPGSINTVTSVPVTYRVLGTEHTADVPLPYALSIESLPHCPYP